MITGGEAIIKCLELEGVKVVFGYPGAVICPFYDNILKTNIKHILVRQEQNAGHAASGYARITKKPSVCVATSGPGATNLITALATAYMDSIPLIAITGQINSVNLGRDVFQEADITGAAEPFTKHSFLVKNASEIPEIFHKAFYVANSGRPGPVLIDIPIDVQNTQFNFKEYNPDEKPEMRSYKPTINGHVIQLKKIINAISNSKRPLVCFGGGVFLSDAQKQANEFIKALQVPCVCTLMGLGVIETENPLFLGMIGVHGKAKANSALHKADLLCIVGARLCDRTVADTSSLPKDFTVIHIDVDPAEIGKNIKVNIPVVGDARSVLNKLNEMINKTPINNFTNWCNELDVYKKPVEKIFKKPANGFINPKQLCYELSKKLDNDAIVIADVGQNQIWSAANIQIKNGRFLTSGGMGTMGYSLPCAMGVKSADNSKQVVSICGDGSFQMCFMELATLVQNNINIKIIVMKNNSLGMVREIQKNKYGGRLSATVLSEKPDFSLIASAYGIKSLTLNNNDNISEALDLFLKDDQCFLLECIVDPEESTL